MGGNAYRYLRFLFVKEVNRQWFSTGSSSSLTTDYHCIFFDDSESRSGFAGTCDVTYMNVVKKEVLFVKALYVLLVVKIISK